MSTLLFKTRCDRKLESPPNQCDTKTCPWSIAHPNFQCFWTLLNEESSQNGEMRTFTQSEIGKIINLKGNLKISAFIRNSLSAFKKILESEKIKVSTFHEDMEVSPADFNIESFTQGIRYLKD